MAVARSFEQGECSSYNWYAAACRCLWPQVVIVSYYMLRMLADSIGKFDWKAVSGQDLYPEAALHEIRCVGIAAE